MAKPTQLPQLIAEFIELAKAYLRESIIGPAKRLGRLFGFGMAASVLFVLGSLFVATAAVRLIVEAMPDGSIWSGFGYVVAAVALLVTTGLVMWRASK